MRRPLQSPSEDSADLNLWQRFGLPSGGLARAACLLIPALAAVAAMAIPETPLAGDDDFATARRDMVEKQCVRRGVRQPEVLAALQEVPRHRFLPDDLQPFAYGDHPLPIGHQQTISQPYIVALMTELLEATGQEKVLEIGTGSGYHAAVMSRVVDEVYTIEIVEELGRRAAEVLRSLGYDNVHVRVGDGYDGWPDQAPFDAVVLTAAPTRIPQQLVEQLRMGGRLVLPLGDDEQHLEVLTKTEAGLERREVIPVRFVPMTGKIRQEAVN